MSYLPPSTPPPPYEFAISSACSVGPFGCDSTVASQTVAVGGSMVTEIVPSASPTSTSSMETTVQHPQTQQLIQQNVERPLITSQNHLSGGQLDADTHRETEVECVTNMECLVTEETAGMSQSPSDSTPLMS